MKALIYAWDSASEVYQHVVTVDEFLNVEGQEGYKQSVAKWLDRFGKEKLPSKVFPTLARRFSNGYVMTNLVDSSDGN